MPGEELDGSYKIPDALYPSFLPENVLYRDQEIAQLARHLSPALKDQQIPDFSVSGPKNTGKTVVARHAVRRAADDAAQSLEMIYIDCRVRDRLYKIAVDAFQTVTKEKIPQTGLSGEMLLDRTLRRVKSTGKSYVVVLDHADKLIDAQDVVLDLVERRDTARAKLGIGIVYTQAPGVAWTSKYTRDELAGILRQRVELSFEKGSVTDDAIDECLTLGHSSIGQSLAIMRQAGKIANNEQAKTIDAQMMRRAERKWLVKRLDGGVHMLDRQQKIFLAAAAVTPPESRTTGGIYQVYTDLCAASGTKPVVERRTIDYMAALDARGIARKEVQSNGNRGRTSHVELRYEPLTVLDVLAGHEEMAPLVERCRRILEGRSGGPGGI